MFRLHYRGRGFARGRPVHGWVNRAIILLPNYHGTGRRRDAAGVTCWAYLCVSHLGLPFVSLPSSERGQLLKKISSERAHADR